MDIEKLAKKHEAEFTDWQDGREAEIAFYGGASQLERFAEAYHQAKCNEEIQTLRAKVASADVLVKALSTIRHNAYMDSSNNKTVGDIFKVADKAIMAYDKLS